MSSLLKGLAATLAAALAVAACGGGGGSSGSAGVSTMSAGTISGFGSVFVNNVRYDDSGATITNDLGQPLSRADLSLGANVTVLGTSSGATGTATTIVVEPQIRGTLSAAPAANSFTVLGQTITVDANTAFSGVANLAALAAGDYVEVHGVSSGSNFIATLVVKRVDPATVYNLAGQVTSVVSPTSFTIGGLTVNYAPANLIANGLTLQTGVLARVTATSAPSAGAITATRVVLRNASTLFNQNAGLVRLKGILAALPDVNGNTTVSGLPVNLSNAVKDGTLSAGVRVELVGTLSATTVGNVPAGTLIVSNIETEDHHRASQYGVNVLIGNIADFTGLTANVGSFTVNGVSVSVDANTLYVGGAAGTLAGGVFVEVRGDVTTVTTPASGSGANAIPASTSTVVVAKQVNFRPRGEHDRIGAGQREIYGAIANFVSVSNFTVNDITVDASSAGLSVEQIALLANGVLVEVKGTIDATSGKMTARALEFENRRNSRIPGKGNGSGAAPAPTPSTPPSQAATAGKALYATYCSGCHSAPASVSRGASVSVLQNAIDTNRGGMGQFATGGSNALTASQVSDISAYLAAPF